MEFSKESTKELNKLLMIVVKELEKIRKLNQEQDFVEYIELPEEEMKHACRSANYYDWNKEWNLSLSKDEYSLVYGRGKNHLIINIAKRAKFGFKLSYDEEDKEALLIFLKHYPEARKRLIKRVETEELKRKKEAESKQMDQERTLEELKRLKKLYNKEATIEIEVPNTNNQHILEVKEEQGKKVGTLSINGLTLRIIASDGIKVVNKPTVKVKRK